MITDQLTNLEQLLNFCLDAFMLTHLLTLVTLRIYQLSHLLTNSLYSLHSLITFSVADFTTLDLLTCVKLQNFGNL